MANKYQTIKLEKQDDIGVLSLNRPEKLNALSVELFHELHDCFSQLWDDLKTRVIILRGEGKHFCVGADLNEGVQNPRNLGDNQNLFEIQRLNADIVVQMRRAPQPVIGAIRGAACGGGFSLALGCDMRIAGESTKFNAAYIRIGYSGTDIGCSYYLPRIIGFSRAAEYLYTGRFMDAVTAEKFGMVSRVVKDEEVDGVALELAREITLNSPFGVRLTKEALHQNVDAPSLEAAINLENRNQVLCHYTEDHDEGVEAFLRKRKPDYKDR